MRGFLGITAHFITDWTLNSVMLACSRFHGHHTAENISEHVDETVASFAISRKLDHITTDNASNMVKAFRLPGFGADDTCASTPESDDTYDETPEPVSIQDSVTSVHHEPCFDHTLQLVVKDGLAKAGQLTRVIAKASKIVAHVRKSVHATEILEGRRSFRQPL